MIPHLQPITLEVILPHRDLVRLAELKAKNWNPSPLTSAEAIELLELQQRVNARLDDKISQEQEQAEREQPLRDVLAAMNRSYLADLAHDIATETRAFPSHPNPHCD